MDSLFAKVIFLFSFLLASITGPSYIKIAQDSLIFNFKTGEVFPIYYYLNIQNIGPQKARFEVSSDVQWISVYREGSDFAFVELPPQLAINFILEIRPERLPDGVNKAKVFIKVLDINLSVSQELVLDQVEVSITLNRNLVLATPGLNPTPSPSLSLTPVVSPTPVPAQTRVADLNPILKQIQSLIDSIRILLGKIF